MLLFCTRLMYELSGEESLLAYFEELAEEIPEGGVFSRKEILSQGCAHEMATSFGNQMWICTYVHLAMREMIALDRSRSEFYERGLYQNGVTALKNVEGISKYQNALGGFDIDWRNLNELWEDYQKDVAKGTEIAQKQFSYWHKHNVPRRKMEHSVLGNALFSAWVAITSGDCRIASRAAELLMSDVEAVDWEEYHLSYAFVVESALIFADAQRKY